MFRARLERLREDGGRRAVAIAVAVLLELLIFAALLSLAYTDEPAKAPEVTLVSVDVSDAADAASEPEPEQARSEEASVQPSEPVEPAEPVDTPTNLPIPPPAAVLPATRALPPPPASPPAPPAPTPKARAVLRDQAMGPADTRAGGSSGDTPIVGKAPNGEPLYAAKWYREPYDDELRGYLSTATGPGWGLIACRTAPDYRVEDCVALEEQPRGSNINRAVLAAAWQFKVRPPRRGNQSLVGAWVRIRIDYDLERR